MRYRKLTSTGDYSFGNNQYDFYKDSPEAVAQSVQTRLKLWLGEWFLDIEDGTPWIQGVLGKQQASTYDALLRARILETEGVTEIVTYTSTLNTETRKLNVSCVLNTIYGVTRTIEV